MGVVITSILGSVVKEAILAKVTGTKKKVVGKAKKGLVQSKTAWGGVFMAAPWILEMFGITMGAEEAQAIFEAFSTIVGLVGVIWGRMGKMKEIG